MRTMTIAALVLLSGVTAASAQYSPNNNPQNDPQQEMLNRERVTPPRNNVPMERNSATPRQPGTTGQGDREGAPSSGGAPAGYPRTDNPVTGR